VNDPLIIVPCLQGIPIEICKQKYCYQRSNSTSTTERAFPSTLCRCVKL